MLWIGLTGGIATGKSTVAKILRARGYDVIDADVLSREVVRAGRPAHAAVAQAFGPGVMSADGELDRAAIGAIVFNDKMKLALLEGIIHPHVRAAAEARRAELRALGRVVSFYDVPLLFEKRMQPLFDQVVVVACTPLVQLERLMKRNGFTKEEAGLRIAAQMPIDDKVARADFVVDNNHDLAALDGEVDRCLAFLLKSHQAQT